MDQDMVIFARTFDLLEWLLPKSERFPRIYRSTVTQRLMDAALDLQEALVAAEPRRGRSRISALRNADAALGRLRVYLRLIPKCNDNDPFDGDRASAGTHLRGRFSPPKAAFFCPRAALRVACGASTTAQPAPYQWAKALRSNESLSLHFGITPVSIERNRELSGPNGGLPGIWLIS